MIEPISIELSPRELLVASMVASFQQIEAILKCSKGGYGLDRVDVDDRKDWDKAVLGCCGELAAAKALGVYWSALDGQTAVADLGTRFQVRTATRPTDRLIVHDDDKDDATFVLVLGRPPRFEVVGTIIGRDAKRAEYWTDPGTGRPAFFVPRFALTTITTRSRGDLDLDVEF